MQMNLKHLKQKVQDQTFWLQVLVPSILFNHVCCSPQVDSFKSTDARHHRLAFTVDLHEGLMANNSPMLRVVMLRVFAVL